MLRTIVLTGLLACLPPASAWALNLVEVPAGAVVMGDPAGEADETARTVTLGRFRLMRHEATNAAFAAFVAATGHLTSAERSGKAWVWDGRWNLVAGADWRHPFGPATTIAGQGDHPVVQVSVHDARAFCAFHGLRLPTEAEWEHAARAGSDTRWFFGDDATPLERYAWSNSNAGNTVHPVAQLEASPWGLHDIYGNVWGRRARRIRPVLRRAVFGCCVAGRSAAIRGSCAPRTGTGASPGAGPSASGSGAFVVRPPSMVEDLFA